jgi:hypothetical protein
MKWKRMGLGHVKFNDLVHNVVLLFSFIWVLNWLRFLKYLFNRI